MQILEIGSSHYYRTYKAAMGRRVSFAMIRRVNGSIGWTMEEDDDENQSTVSLICLYLYRCTSPQ